MSQFELLAAETNSYILEVVMLLTFSDEIVLAGILFLSSPRVQLVNFDVVADLSGSVFFLYTQQNALTHQLLTRLVFYTLDKPRTTPALAS